MFDAKSTFCHTWLLDMLLKNGTINPYSYPPRTGEQKSRPRARKNQRNGGNQIVQVLKRSAKGAAVPHTKATAGQPTNKMPVPEHVVIPMSMHIGAPAEPVVKKGDTVMVGTVIGKAGGFVSANIYPVCPALCRTLHRCVWSTAR